MRTAVGLRMNPRMGYGIGLLACIALLASALYLQYVEHQEPCPLCILQRIAFTALMIVFAAAALHAPGRRGAIVYSTLAVIVAGVGAAIASRQVWLQMLPAHQVPACGPGLEYMLERFPLTQAMQKIFAGSGECAEAGWRFMGLTIAGWSLTWFVVLALLAVYVAARASRGTARTI
jgi:protein dithiol:quinone oxidoreductase